MTSIFHRNVWQRLPAGWRRQTLFRATALLAPRPTPNAAASDPIVVAGVLRSATGLGESARLCHDALRAAGFDVYGVDLSAALMQPDDVEFAFRDGRGVIGAGVLIAHVNAPLLPLALLRLGHKFVSGKRVIGYWAWELPRVADDWKYGAHFVHEIWVPSSFTAAAIAPVAKNVPIRIVPHPVAVRSVAAAAPNVAMQADKLFTVLTMFDMGSSFARKNPAAAVAAFRGAFGDDPSARLIVKAMNASSFEAGRAELERLTFGARNIEVIGGRMSSDELTALYGRSDVLLSLHRSEGFGLSLAEAMLHGVVVVATDWSGNKDFLSHATGFPVPYRLVQAVDPQGTYDHPDQQWADADATAAAALLRRLRANPQLCVDRAAAAAAYAASNWTVDSYAATVRSILGRDQHH